MPFEKPSPEHGLLALRAMKTVATVGGTRPLSSYHLACFQALQTHVFESDHDIMALAHIEPSDLADAIPDPHIRQLALRELAYIAMTDPDGFNGEVTAVVDRFASAMDVHSGIVDAMHHAAKNQVMRLQLDALRLYTSTFKPESWTDTVRLMWQAVAPFMGVTNQATARRYQALEDAAPGTLGAAYFDFIRSRGLPFPGEKGGAPELYFVAHDLTHILAGYDTDRDGEVGIIGFEAGFRRSGGLDIILLALVQAQLGIVLDPVAPASTGMLNFDLLMSAYRRGCECSVDFSDGWDYWAVMDQTVESLRGEYGITV